MGWRYRKSTKIGPFRLNFSKSGIGWSVGFGHYRRTKMANGRIRRTVTMPFGVSYVEETKGSGKTAKAAKAAKPSAASSQSGYGPRWKVILLGVLLIICGLYNAPTNRVVGCEISIIGIAILAWDAWRHHKIKNQNRPVVEDTPAAPEEKE